MHTTRPLIAVTAVALLGGCQIVPMASDPTGRADADMLRVLTAFQASAAKPINTLSVTQARAQLTLGDAATEVAFRWACPPRWLWHA